MSAINIQGLRIDSELHQFIETEALPGTGINPEGFWTGLAALIGRFAPENAELLRHRDRLQGMIDDWHRTHGATDAGYHEFLREIGYIQADPGEFTIDSNGMDAEIATIAGPQLVVPVDNARYALNAANARWGSLYDALYGTDAIDTAGVLSPAGGFNPERGRAVVAFGRDLLDRVWPLEGGLHRDAVGYRVVDDGLVVDLADGGLARLRDPAGFAGWRGEAAAPQLVLLRRHGLHLEVIFDRNHKIGAGDPAGIADLIVESAISAIMDAEDSVAAVDAADKIRVYRNWLGLMKGDLRASFDKNGRTIERSLAPDREYQTPQGTLKLPGRSLMLVRNVGHHMLTDMICDSTGNMIPETIADLTITCLIALHDLRGGHALHNSRAGSIYVVKPKLHGPAEVAFANRLFDAVEDLLGLARHTIKLGIMDEERRTSVNLAACIFAARHRVMFINTGFLDRTGDEIHTAMEAGPMVRKGAIKQCAWIAAYEQRNVAIGLAHGLKGRAQIGKGMWAMPDRMAAMMAEKINHPRAGATTAWVPSPTAASLHALHYLSYDVASRQTELAGSPPAPLKELLRLPVATGVNFAPDEIAEELDNNIQGILGYVVRWVDQGVGCSKVPDIHDVGLMEDRATLRISSQHVANWLRHGVINAAMVEASLRRMAVVVDRQNASDPVYRPMAPGFDGIAFHAARDLIFEGVTSPNGYTEAVLHRRRREVKTA